MVLDFRCGERIFVIMSMTRNHHSAPFDSRLLSGLGVLAAVVEAGQLRARGRSARPDAVRRGFRRRVD
jgi:hypothetical protein